MPDPIENGDVLEQAFILMELEPPSSLDDGSAKATAAAKQLPRAFKIVLESYDWSFARKIHDLPMINLAQENIPVDPDLPYAARLPADCVALRKVYLDTRYRYRVDEDIVRTEVDAPLTVRYTSSDYRLKFMPQTFQQLVAYQLAMMLAPKYVKTRSKREQLRSEMADASYAARSNDAHTASVGRLDGTQDVIDWAQEAVT
ncbi:hypothetical protein [Roseovarius atlanticus]|uniref:hypothetical protein n=1 Tax=Roseovarius atlanticus TaxID=1641875 RepID=UPI001C957759|nr:hypothetical protein [Roseovarius atlanticus]MBY5988214.1 hypothetical protein [Roseovarius atlanticus]MBY6123605.1 hypothetical protein [Roseovarius atlanticus]MBY6148100.1 hypothetical protein [Roseovarius atlanticus]